MSAILPKADITGPVADSSLAASSRLISKENSIDPAKLGGRTTNERRDNN
jgi:hypothetical protein